MGLITRNLAQLKEYTRRVVAESRPTTQPLRTDVRGGGVAAATGFVFPVTLTPAGGSNGSATAACSFRYNIVDLDGTVLRTNQTPVAAPHQWKRPGVGWMSLATFGLAYRDSNDQVVLTWINETYGQEICS